MYVRHLGLHDFRSWEQVDLELAPGPTVFVGANGYGKTNLVEALWYCAALSSHRVATDAPLIRAGSERAVISTIVVNENRELAVDIEIAAGRANKARLNKSPVRSTREILGAVRAVLFAPEDLALVRGDPSERRRYLDELGTIRRPRIAGIRADYDKVLRQRTALLKSATGARLRSDRAAMDTLDVWDGHLAAHGGQLMAARLELTNELASRVQEAYQDLAPSSRPAAISYRSAVDTTSHDAGALETALLKELIRRRDAELERGVCLVGPHRDDLELRLGEQPAKGFASHGESWSLALALRLAAYALLRSEGSEPVLILDDVFAELDSARRRALSVVAADAEQVLVTAAVDDDIPGDWRDNRIGISMCETESGRASTISEVSI